MVERDVVLKEMVKFVGISDFKGAYEYSYEWLKSEGFNVIEEKYTEKVSGDSKDIEVKWNADKKITDYFKIRLEIVWEIFGMTEVEVEIDGKRKRMNKFGEINIKIKGILERDWNSRWTSKPTHKFFKDIYYKYIVPERIEKKQLEVQEVVQNLNAEMKAYFDLTGKKKAVTIR